jgi:hypothetical protein
MKCTQAAAHPAPMIIGHSLPDGRHVAIKKKEISI